MFLDARQVRTAGGAFDGNRAVGVPDKQISFGAEWDTPFVRGLTVTGRIIYSGKVYADSANTLELPDWARVDLGVRYTFEPSWKDGKPITLRFAVENLFNRSFWVASLSGNQIFLGEARTFLLSTTFRF